MAEHKCICGRGDKCHPLICYPTKAERILAYDQVLRDNYPKSKGLTLSSKCCIETISKKKYIHIFDQDETCAICEKSCMYDYDGGSFTFSDKMTYMTCGMCLIAGRRLCNVTGREIAECVREYRNMMDRMYAIFKWMVYEFKMPSEIFMELFTAVMLTTRCPVHK